MRPSPALLRTFAVIAITLSACSSQTVIGPVAPADEPSAGLVSEAVNDGDGDPIGQGSDETEAPVVVPEPAAPESIPSAWVGVSTQDGSAAGYEFDALIDNLADAAGLRTTFTATLDSYGSPYSSIEVRESNRGESGGIYATEFLGDKVLADGLVWTTDRDRPNLYVGVEADARDEKFTNGHLIKKLQDSIVEVVGYEQDTDGSARWYLLADPTEFMEPFDYWKATGSVFDMALTIATVDPSGALVSMDMDVAAAGYVRFKDDFSLPPYAFQIGFEAFESRLPIGPPCSDPTASTDDQSRDVLHCPIDSEGFIAPHVSIGYLDDPTAVSQAFLVANLLGTLGYSVDLVPLTEGVDAAYDELAANNIDIYASGWFPTDEGQLARVTADGNTVGETIERFDDPLVPHGRVSGLVVTTEWADAADISSIDDINSDPALYGEIDTDGNGKGEIEGCPVSHACRPWLEAQIASVWTNLELTDRSYQQAFHDLFLASILGDPALAVVTMPDPRFSNAFGDWSVVSVPGGVGGSEDAFGPACREGSYPCERESLCRNVVEPCLPVFAQADLEAVANAEWVAANPVGAALVEQITIDASWLRAVADDAASDDSDTGLFKVEPFGADNAADGWVSSREALIEGWMTTALAVDPSFGDVPVEEPEPGSESEFDGTRIERPPLREGDLLAWEQAVLRAVQESGAIERGDSTELLSSGAGAVCDGAVEADAMMQLFDAAQGRFADLGAQMTPFLDLLQVCDLKPTPKYLGLAGGVEAEALPDSVDEWHEFIAHVQQSGAVWGSVDDVEIMAARSCNRNTPRLAGYSNGYSIGAGMMSTSQMQTLASVLDAGCPLGSEGHWRQLVLFDTGRDELRQVFGHAAVETVADAEFACMVNAAVARGPAPPTVDPVASMAPVCAPTMVIEADTVRYTSDVVDAAAARCVAEGLVGLAVSNRDPAMYFGRWLSPIRSDQQALVSRVVRDGCGLTDAQVEDLGIRGL